MERKLILKKESYAIMGACFDVYKENGNGYLEAVYQECLGIELREKQIPFIEQPKLQLKYKGKKLKQIYTPDFLCFDKIILEIKAAKHLVDEHRAQIINYMKAMDKPLGLLVNFGHHPKLQYERYVNTNIKI